MHLAVFDSQHADQPRPLTRIRCAVLWLADGSKLLLGGSTLTLWDAESQQRVARLTGHPVSTLSQWELPCVLCLVCRLVCCVCLLVCYGLDMLHSVLAVLLARRRAPLL